MDQLIKLTEEEVAALLQQYPNLPHDYASYMRQVGWGEAENGKMIYSGPISPTDVYGAEFAPSSVILFGDDLQGYCFGFDLLRGQYDEADPKGNWLPDSGDQGLAEHVR